MSAGRCGYTDPKRQEALDVEEKSYRVTNFIISMREGMHNLAVAAGLHSPTEFIELMLSIKM
ncbi:hypothetical protein ACFOLK_18745 [Marinococcus halophilus]|uniref:hypothetical protein n=1 Tax=Marinococcus halophilus TaxID=1371 RepID=UPI00361BF30E